MKWEEVERGRKTHRMRFRGEGLRVQSRKRRRAGRRGERVLEEGKEEIV